MLAHPRSSDLARNAICVFRQGEQEDEDQVRIVNLRNMSREPARIDNSLHGLASCLHRRVGHWVAQVQVVDDDVHEPDLTPWGHHVLWRHSRTAHPMLVEFEGELELGGLSRSLTSPPADNDDSERRTSVPTRMTPDRPPLRINSAPTVNRTAKITPIKPTSIESSASPIANKTATAKSVFRAVMDPR